MFQVFFYVMTEPRVKQPVTDEFSCIDTFEKKYINIIYANGVLLQPSELYRGLINSRWDFCKAQYWHD